MPQVKDRVTDIYWHDIIKNVLSESKTSLYATEIWEKMRDLFAYSYDKNRLKQDLLSLQRTGYAKSVIKNGKQAWVFPSSNELFILEKNKNIDFTLANLINTLNRVPTIEEGIDRMKNELTDKQQLLERLTKISKLTKSVDEIIKHLCYQDVKQLAEEREKIEKTKWVEPTCNIDIGDTPFYEAIIEKLNGIIEDIDILTVIHIINSRQKFLTYSQNK